MVNDNNKGPTYLYFVDPVDGDVAQMHEQASDSILRRRYQHSLALCDGVEVDHFPALSIDDESNSDH